MAKDQLLDRVILSFSERDHASIRTLINGGVLITGGLGQGKSSTSLKQICYGALRAGLGALFTTVKSSDTADYIALAKAANREKDVIVFNVESRFRFDPL